MPALAGNRMNPPTSPEKPPLVKWSIAWWEAHWVKLLLGIIGGTVLALLFSESLFVLFAKIGNWGSFFSSQSFPFAITDNQFTPNDYLTHLGHFRQGLLTLGGGLVGVLVAWRGYMNLQHQKEELAHDKDKFQAEQAKEQKRIEEETKREQNQRFAQAVGLLGHEAVAVRTGAIYSLQQLMVEAPETMGLKSCRLLAGYVNEHGPKVQWDKRGNLQPRAVDAKPADLAIMAALQVLAERNLEAEEAAVNFNFAELDWGRCDTQAHGFYATDVYASKAFFERTKEKLCERERNTKLCQKSFLRAHLNHADLRHYNLIEARLIQASLVSADCESINLRGANLNKADLQIANLGGAKLLSAKLQGANLHMAHDLRGRKCISANSEEELDEKLRESNPYGTGEKLTFEEIKKQYVKFDEHTIFPDGTRRNRDGTIIAEEPTP